jgi:hypothetical protein
MLTPPTIVEKISEGIQPLGDTSSSHASSAMKPSNAASRRVPKIGRPANPMKPAA